VLITDQPRSADQNENKHVEWRFDYIGLVLKGSKVDSVLPPPQALRWAQCSAIANYIDQWNRIAAIFPLIKSFNFQMFN
jgi:hypothetical protein